MKYGLKIMDFLKFSLVLCAYVELHYMWKRSIFLIILKKIEIQWQQSYMENPVKTNEQWTSNIIQITFWTFDYSSLYDDEFSGSLVIGLRRN